MSIYGYEIGTTLGGMTNLEELTTPVTPPRASYRPYSQLIELGDGGVRGVGYPTVEWRWSVLPRAQRDQLRAFCGGAGATVYIQTSTNDSQDAYAVFSGVMVWPEEEERDATRRMEFVVRFQGLVEVIP